MLDARYNSYYFQKTDDLELLREIYHMKSTQI